MGDAAEVHALPLGHHLAVDERGIGLRLTWRLDRGFVNLSLWRDDTCVETFHLRPAEAAELVGFLSRGLAEAAEVGATRAAGPPLQAVADPPSRRERTAAAARRAVEQARATGARHLDAVAARLRPRSTTEG